MNCDVVKFCCVYTFPIAGSVCNSYYIDPPLTQCFHHAYATTYQTYLTSVSGIAIIIAHAVLIIRVYEMN